MKFYLLFITLLLVGCMPSSLKLNKTDTLLLEHDSMEYRVANKVTTKKLTHFLYLDVLRYTVEDEGAEKLFFEQLYTDINYEFKYGSVRTITDIFDVSSYNFLYYSSGLLLIQLEVEPNKYVNVLAETSSTQDMSYVYGFSDSEFKDLIQSLGVKVDLSKMKKGYEAKESLTSWSQAHLVLFPLVKPMFRTGMF